MSADASSQIRASFWKRSRSGRSSSITQPYCRGSLGRRSVAPRWQTAPAGGADRGCYGAPDPQSANGVPTRGVVDPLPVLDVREVSVRFGGIVALDELSFSVDAVAFNELIGPNGA